MTQYGRLQLLVELGLSSDYSDALQVKGKRTATPDEATVFKMEAVAAAGATLELGLFTTITDVIILNHDTAATVTATFTAASTVSKNVLAAAASSTSPSFCVLGAIDPTVDLVLVASTGTPAVTVIIFGT